jgi:hypothetical protein
VSKAPGSRPSSWLPENQNHHPGERREEKRIEETRREDNRREGKRREGKRREGWRRLER